MVNTFVFFLLRHKVLMYVQSDWQLLVSSSGSYSWDQSQSDITYKCRSIYSGLLNLSLPVCKNDKNMWKILHKDFTTGFTVYVANDHFILIIHLGTSVKSFQSLFLVNESFVAHCIGHIDLQTSTPRILCQATGKFWFATKMWKYGVHRIVTVRMLQLL
jgi:hypothetical protein